MKKLLLFTMALLAQHSALAAENFSTLEERMTGKELIETGLNKLSSDELAALNEWIRRHSVAPLENAAARPATTVTDSTGAGSMVDPRGFEHKSNHKKNKDLGKTIHTHIVGAFSGWKGKKTRFKLANGMIWQQDEKDNFSIREIDNPEVTIKKGFFGTWRLSVVGYHSSVQVKRIQ